MNTRYTYSMGGTKHPSGLNPNIFFVKPCSDFQQSDQDKARAEAKFPDATDYQATTS